MKDQLKTIVPLNSGTHCIGWTDSGEAYGASLLKEHRAHGWRRLRSHDLAGAPTQTVPSGGGVYAFVFDGENNAYLVTYQTMEREPGLDLDPVAVAAAEKEADRRRAEAEAHRAEITAEQRRRHAEEMAKQLEELRAEVEASEKESEAKLKAAEASEKTFTKAERAFLDSQRERQREEDLVRLRERQAVVAAQVEQFEQAFLAENRGLASISDVEPGRAYSGTNHLMNARDLRAQLDGINAEIDELTRQEAA